MGEERHHLIRAETVKERGRERVFDRQIQNEYSLCVCVNKEEEGERWGKERNQDTSFTVCLLPRKEKIQLKSF